MLILLPLFASLLEIIYYFNGSPPNATLITTTTYRPATVPVPVTTKGRFFRDKTRNPLLTGTNNHLSKNTKKNFNLISTGKKSDISVTKSVLETTYLTTAETVDTGETTELYESQVVVNSISSKESETNPLYPEVPSRDLPTEPKLKQKFMTKNPQLTNLGKIHREPLHGQLKKLNSLQKSNLVTKAPGVVVPPRNPIAKLQSRNLGRGSTRLMIEQAATKNQLMKLKSLQIGRSLSTTTESTKEEEQFTKMKSLQLQTLESAKQDDHLTKLKSIQIGRSFDTTTEHTSQEEQISKLKSSQLEQSFVKETDLKKQEAQLSQMRVFQENQSSGLIESMTQDPVEQMLQVQETKAATTVNVIADQIEGRENYGKTPIPKAENNIEGKFEEVVGKSPERTIGKPETLPNPRDELEKLRTPSRTLLKDIIDGQEYGIQNNNNGLYLTVLTNNDANANGVHTISVTGWQNTTNQKWTIVRKDNMYEVYCITDNSYELISNSTVRNVITTGPNNQTRQWKIAVDDADAFIFQLMSEDGHECVGANGQLQTSDCNDAFLWSFISDDQLQLKTTNFTLNINTTIFT